MPTNLLFSDSPIYLNPTELAYVLTQAVEEQQRLIVALTVDVQSALQLRAELRLFAEGKQWQPRLLPDWGTLPYDTFSPNPEIIAERLKCLYELPTLEAGILIIPANTALQRLPPAAFLSHHVLMLKLGDKLDINSFRLRLDAGSYRHTAEVHEVGEYSVRGAIIDLFPSGLRAPIRIELFDDEIDSIRHFDPKTQRTTEKVEHIELLPAREFPMTAEAISQFRQQFRETFDGDTTRAPIYQAVSDGQPPAGIEYYLPLFFDNLALITDYLPKNALWVKAAMSDDASLQFLQDTTERYEARRHDVQRPVLPPEQLYATAAQWQTAISSFECLTLSADADNKPAQLGTLPPMALAYKAAEPARELLNFIADNVTTVAGKICFLAESDGRREVLLETLHRFDIFPKTYSSWTQFLISNDAIGMVVGQNNDGLWLREANIALVAEGQLHESWVPQTRRQSSASRSPETIIKDLTELNVGDPVVHEQQGIGRYGGLIYMEVGGHGNEYALIEYADDAKLYVPVTSLHLISRYTGGGENPPLHRLGSEQWSRAKARALKRASDTAAELLDVYARRQRSVGNAMELDEKSYASFANGFAFQETPDQAAAIVNVIRDLTAEKAMDRLVCGDVGFGKTEVAMRAAFVAVHAGYQVAMLSPTTLLTQQHAKNFMDRFADWPVKVAELSRFKTAKEQKAILDQLAAGQIDIIIGTHKLLAATVKYKSLGLVIIDEEHRFGVKHKEKLKSLRAEVDILTLTATPIPRTLNLAVSGMRELSIIATPPLGRLPIQTFIQPWNDAQLKEAITRELNRGGQVYFLHNEVRTMPQIAEKLLAILPDLKIGMAHGQMNERELEQVMTDFYHQRVNLMLCSTIVESGIDVPSANTMIINRADKLGLAQLHQIRGRVGRSSHRAYAYLLTPEHGVMTSDAKKRLDAIEQIDDLGAGYLLANHDLEIRGAGEILGDEQSGQITEVGFSLYMDMLNEAIHAIERGDDPALEKALDDTIEVDIGAAALIPASYLPDIHARMTLYKRIGFCKNREALYELQVEMVDRFGLLPEETKNLFLVTQLKQLAQQYGMQKITANDKMARLVFDRQPRIDAGKLILLIQRENQRYQLDGQDIVKIKMPMPQPETRLLAVEKLLEQIAPEDG